jgi:hypothetical protein
MIIRSRDSLPLVCRNAPIQPSNCSLAGLLEPLGVGVSGVNDVVKLHHDVGTDRSLLQVGNDKIKSKFQNHSYVN